MKAGGLGKEQHMYLVEWTIQCVTRAASWLCDSLTRSESADEGGVHWLSNGHR